MKKTIKRSISALLAVVILFALFPVYNVPAKAAPNYRCIDLASEEAISIAEVHNTSLAIDAKKGAMVVTSLGTDPVVRFKVSEGKVSADEFKYLVLVYEVNSSIANASKSQFFLSSDKQNFESADASSTFFCTKGEIAYTVADLSSLAMWSGNAYAVRIDPFAEYYEGDQMYLYSLGFARTAEEAKAYGEQFCNNNSAVLLGDEDRDGVVSAKDLLSVLRYIAGVTNVSPGAVCDANSDGTVDVKDMQYIKKNIAGVEASKYKNSLTVSLGDYNPVEIHKGKGYTVSGSVRSDFNISSVNAGIYDASGNATAYVKSAAPNAKSCDLSALCSDFAFASLGEGSYKLVISATDESGKTKALVDNSFMVLPPESTLAIGAGTYSPVALAQGKSYSISGNITSNYLITKVIVGVLKEDLSATDQLVSVSPNAYSYNISAVDASIKFGGLAAGNYYFVVNAEDASGTVKTLVNSSFKVVGVNEEVSAFQQRALSTWIKPVRAKILSVVGTGRGFGAYRTSTRLHAGIDYYVSNGAGTPVYAMQSGTVIEYLPSFYYGTNSVAVQHADGSVARYCEISTSLRVGDKVTQGQQIATIKANTLDGGTMLHLELYLGTATGSLSRTNTTYDYVTGNYNRRRDILNPEFLLNLTREQ